MTQLKLSAHYHPLHFIVAAKTSRDTLYEKPSWFIRLSDSDGRTGWGECSLIPGLSRESIAEINAALAKLVGVHKWDRWTEIVQNASPSLRFALETAERSYKSQDGVSLYPTEFARGTSGIPINGLIWMGDDEYVISQMHARAEEGFRILKMKIGAHDFTRELKLLERIRTSFPSDRFELRLDANGAFSPDEALGQLRQLAQFDIHSIEQPIGLNQESELARICAESPIPIALDEELIGRNPNREWLARIRPHYLILKPGLLGGFMVTESWTSIAAQLGIGWWATSALESNIGLNAIAQWCAAQDNPLPQGLGTGRLFSNNIPSPLTIRDAKLFTRTDGWKFPKS